MLREAGLSVTVHDRKTEAELGEVYQRQAHGASFSLGVHYLDTSRRPIAYFALPGLHPITPPKAELVRAAV